MDAAVMEIESLPKWWSLLLRGIAALTFGIIALAWPKSTTKVLVILFGVFVLVAAAVAIGAAIVEARRGESVFLSLMFGVVCLIIGILVVAYPGAATVSILYLIAAWAIIYGFILVISAFEFPKNTGTRIRPVLGITGVLSLIIGIILFAIPGLSVFGIILIIAAYAIAQGILLIIVSFWVRALYKGLAAA